MLGAAVISSGCFEAPPLATEHDNHDAGDDDHRTGRVEAPPPSVTRQRTTTVPQGPDGSR